MGETNGQTGQAVVKRAEETARDVSAFGSGSDFNQAQRVALGLAKSDLVPIAYQNNVPNVLVAMEYAHRLGASVLAVMQNLDVINGRPGLRATFLMGTVNATGRFTPIRFRWQGEEGTDGWGCRAYARDRESDEECVGPLITIGLAKAEKWFGKRDSKWQTIPELMLMYRAGAWWSRVYAPELALGLHTTDELEDTGATPGATPAEAAAALDAPDGAKPIAGEEIPEAEVVSSETVREATNAQIAGLIDLQEKAVEAGLKLAEEDISAIEQAIESRDASEVKRWAKTLSSMLAHGAASQAALGV